MALLSRDASSPGVQGEEGMSAYRCFAEGTGVYEPREVGGNPKKLPD